MKRIKLVIASQRYNVVREDGVGGTKKSPESLKTIQGRPDIADMLELSYRITSQHENTINNDQFMLSLVCTISSYIIHH